MSSCTKNAGTRTSAVCANKNANDAPSGAEDSVEKSIEVEVSKVDEALGIVFGYAIVCSEDSADYYDVQGDHIPETAMLEATASFMSGQRVAKDMHQGGPVGQVVYGFPVTNDIASSLDINVRKTGFVVGMKPDSQELLEKYASGEYTGFSIGGQRIRETVIDE